MVAFGVTDRGAVRPENQDCFRVSVQEGGNVLAAVLCDGMGGASAGNIASAMAADTFMSHAGNSVDERSTMTDMRAILTEAVNYANIKVYDKSFADFSCMGMGTTLVALIANSKKAAVVNVGDSRAYLISKGSIAQISQDHSLVEEMVARGEISAEEAKNHPKKNIITRAIGVEASVRSDVFEVKLSPGDRVLLCSDGLSNIVSDNEMLTASQQNKDLEKLCGDLLELALSRGAGDNVTVLVAEQ